MEKYYFIDIFLLLLLNFKFIFKDKIFKEVQSFVPPPPEDE